ncbi:hypothetical protein [Ornithinimicrobium avium]|uniref:Uncharacterized protein n=1 Tax=Ornithinimicrobium avium TaxID=2283195 RepID=A0A345NP11_9MICO|nr:hypothetical protein [Ornithinimicrobium avium]AXH96769.1 hypothetical protein DV701_12130 [Ornithinimicrobium avium]
MTPSEGQNPLRSSGPEEVDPTGIRALLRTLPDPGPMPDHLVERITARLAAEHAQRLQDTGSTDGGGRGRVVELTGRRSPRSPGRTLAYLGAAAAGLLVATVAVGELGGGGLLGGTAAELDSAAQVSTRSRVAADAGAADAGGADSAGSDEEAMDGSAGGAAQDLLAQEEAGSAADSAGDDAAAPSVAAADLPVEVLPPLGEVRAGAVRSDVLAALTSEDFSSSGEGTLSVAGAQRCWQTGGDGRSWPERQAAEALYEGDPVVVLVGRDGDAGSAVLLPASCAQGASVDALEVLAWGP